MVGRSCLRDDSLVRVTSVGLVGKSMTDGNLALLRDLSQLQSLILYDTKVTGAGLVQSRTLESTHMAGASLTTPKSPTPGSCISEGWADSKTWGSTTPRSPTPGSCTLEGLSQLATLGPFLYQGSPDAGLEHLRLTQRADRQLESHPTTGSPTRESPTHGPRRSYQKALSRTANVATDKK